MQNIKKIYLYLVSLVSLFIIVFGAISLLNMGLKTWVFPKADSYGYYPPMVCTDPAVKDLSIPVSGECAVDYLEQQKKAEQENRSSQRQRDAAQALSMIVIAAPVFYFHWRLVKKD